MPQPYDARVHGEGWGLGIDSATAQPEMLRLIGRCVTMWPYIEHDLAVCLGVLLRSNTDASVAVFTALRSSRVQQDAIESAAEAILNQNDFILIRACMKVVATTERMRNNVVHGQWGNASNVTDGLIWLAAKHHGPHNARALLDVEYFIDQQHRPIEKRMLVYTEQDLHELISRIAKTREITFLMIIMLRAYDALADEAERLRNALYQEPLVGEALSHLSQDRSGQPTR